MAIKTKGIVAGAILGTIIGTLSTFLLPQQRQLSKRLRNQAQGLLKNAKTVSGNVLDLYNWTETKSTIAKKHFLRGTIMGLLTGVGTALLLAPKTGKQLRKNITQSYQDLADKTTDLVDSFHLNHYHHHAKKKSHKKHPTKKAKARVLSRSRH